MESNYISLNSFIPYGMGKIGNLDTVRVIQLMNIVIEKTQFLFASKYKALDGLRGYFTILQPLESKIYFCIPFGDISIAPYDKQEKYLRLSPEKALRLNQNLKRHTTSHQSRDILNLKYGGAIRCKIDHNHNHIAPFVDLILSFSGAPELCDEAMMLVMGHLIARDFNTKMEPTEANNRNPYWEEILELAREDERVKYARLY